MGRGVSDIETSAQADRSSRDTRVPPGRVVGSSVLGIKFDLVGRPTNLTACGLGHQTVDPDEIKQTTI